MEECNKRHGYVYNCHAYTETILNKKYMYISSEHYIKCY